jgi:hypothetical protein
MAMLLFDRNQPEVISAERALRETVRTSACEKGAQSRKPDGCVRSICSDFQCIRRRP